MVAGYFDRNSLPQKRCRQALCRTFLQNQKPAMDGAAVAPRAGRPMGAPAPVKLAALLVHKCDEPMSQPSWLHTPTSRKRITLPPIVMAWHCDSHLWPLLCNAASAAATAALQGCGDSPLTFSHLSRRRSVPHNQSPPPYPVLRSRCKTS